MKLITLLALLFLVPSCKEQEKINFSTTRQSHTTQLTSEIQDQQIPPTPPKSELLLEKFSTPNGKLWAYITPKMSFRNSRPALIWLSNDLQKPLNKNLWEKPQEDDLRAKIFHEKKVVTMYPSLRGTHGNPGHQEMFYGEIEDIKHAFSYLSKHPNVDPNQIYLIGHGEGATLALLVAGNFNKFKEIYALGPIANLASDAIKTPFNDKNTLESALRSPLNYLKHIQTPTYIIEGKKSPNNMSSFRLLQKNNKNKLLTFFAHPEHNHYNIIQIVSREIVQRMTAL